MPDSLLSQRVPATLTREGRVLLLAELGAALIAGRMPSREAALFVGGAILAWLANGGRLEDYLRVGARRGSHKTPAALWRAHRDEGQLDAGSVGSESDHSEEHNAP